MDAVPGVEAHCFSFSQSAPSLVVQAERDNVAFEYFDKRHSYAYVSILLTEKLL